MQLRDYQAQAVADVRDAFRRGHRRVVLTLPVAAGKTAVFCWIAQAASALNRQTLVLVHRRELWQQASRNLDLFGVQHGVIAPGKPKTDALVHVGSVQTVIRRLDQIDAPDFIIVDECHHAVSGNTWGRIMDRWPEAHVLGVTATPARLDGRGLGEMFDKLIVGPSVSKLTSSGWLCPARVFAPPTSIDLSKIHTKCGDFDPRESADMFDRPKLTGDAISHYKRLLDGKPALAFCTSVQHARNVADQFNAAGIAAASVDGGKPTATRDRLIASLGDGRLQILTSCSIVSEGTDIPVCSGAILLRPTKSLTLHVQMIGRALRICEGKSQAIILDHAGNCLRLGLPDESHQWTLAGKRRRGRSLKPLDSLRRCQNCFAIFGSGRRLCPECHAEYVCQLDAPEQADGELLEIQRREKRREIGRARTREDLLKIARVRGYKPGWVEMILRARIRVKTRTDQNQKSA